MATIKAGTYVFKQTITNPTSNISAVTFKNVKGYYLTANNTYVSAPEDITDWTLTPNGCSFSVGQKPNNMNNWTTSFYDFSSGGVVTYTANDTKLLRTIIVTADQTNVSEAFYNWFMSNIETTPTYTFKHWKKSNVVVNRTLVGQKYYYFKPYTILGLYTITTTLTNCTGASANATKIQENGDLTLTFTANSGYELPTGVSVTNVTSYNWNKSTGVLAISKPTGDVAIEIVAVSALPQLTTPQNVTADGTTVSWDAVEHAENYDIYVDGALIGNTDGGTVSSGYTVTITEANVAGNYSVYINGVIVPRDFSTDIQVFHNVKTFNIECQVTGNRIYNATGSLTNVSWSSGFAYSEDIDITEDSSASLDTDQ